MSKGFMDRYKTYDISKGLGNSDLWESAFRARMNSKEAHRILKDEDKTPHQILEMINSNWSFYTFEALREQFKKMIMEHHPDKGGSTAIAQKIIAAYTLLKRKFGK